MEIENEDKEEAVIFGMSGKAVSSDEETIEISRFRQGYEDEYENALVSRS